MKVGFILPLITQKSSWPEGKDDNFLTLWRLRLHLLWHSGNTISFQTPFHGTAEFKTNFSVGLQITPPFSLYKFRDLLSFSWSLLWLYRDQKTSVCNANHPAILSLVLLVGRLSWSSSNSRNQLRREQLHFGLAQHWPQALFSRKNVHAWTGLSFSRRNQRIFGSYFLSFEFFLIKCPPYQFLRRRW